jgi:glycosyltransferase involved in cell wall biosynthesis
MACLIKEYTNTSKGIVSFTTQEEKYIRYNPSILKSYKDLKNHYMTALHFNWHNFDFYPDNLFDVYMTGKDDLRIKNDVSINHFHFDACNFTPSCFKPTNQEKTWDILYVARAVFFKGIEHFFHTIRKLYDEKKMYRVLFLCPLPPENKKEIKHFLKIYNSLFSPDEQKYFNFLVLKENYPFFFDIYTLSNFYKSSKIFVHTAPDERRCRVAAYALSSGMPLVSLPCVASILPQHLQTDPIYYEAKSIDEFPTKIINALEEYQGSVNTEAIKYLSETYMVDTLKSEFRELFKENDMPFDGRLFLTSLDIRMGHHHGLGKGPNFVPQSLDGFIKTLSKEKSIIKKLEPNSLCIENDLANLSTHGNGQLNTLPIKYKFYQNLNLIVFHKFKLRKIINIIKSII